MTFMMAMKDNVRNLHHQNLEKDARMRELEEQLRRVKVDEGSLQIFKASVEKFMVEQEETIIAMYSHLHMFQETTTTIMEQHSQVQAENTHFNNILERIGDIDKWIVENPDFPIELLHPSSIDRKVDLIALDC
jgi:hypothetical protein